MNLPSTLLNKYEWIFVGPMGPRLPEHFHHLPSLGIDGGAHYFSPLEVWVGDHDSFEGEAQAQHVFKLPKEKDKSDLGMALELFKDFGIFKFHFWGFLGARKDHELFNIGEALSFLERHDGSEILFYSEDGKVYFHLLGMGHWKFNYMGTFSLGTLKKTQVKLLGQCQYPIPKAKTVFPLSSFGLSNVAQGELTLETDGPVFLYFPEGK